MKNDNSRFSFCMKIYLIIFSAKRGAEFHEWRRRRATRKKWRYQVGEWVEKFKCVFLFPPRLSQAFVPWNLIIVFIAVTEKLQRDATKNYECFFADDGEDKNYENCWSEVVDKLVKCILYNCGWLASFVKFLSKFFCCRLIGLEYSDFCYPF